MDNLNWQTEMNTTTTPTTTANSSIQDQQPKPSATKPTSKSKTRTNYYSFLWRFPIVLDDSRNREGYASACQAKAYVHAACWFWGGVPASALYTGTVLADFFTQ